jgi:putative peptide zinc metalloprotease protein
MSSLSRLPTLREDLAIEPGPRLSDGQPSWTLHDPARNQFFQLDWPSFEMLSRWELGEPHEIIAQINRDTTLALDLSALHELLTFLRDQQLLQPAPGAAPALAASLSRQRGGWSQWLLHNYLFFRIPLVRPDRALRRAQPYVSFLFTRGFWWLTLFAAALGGVAAYRESERFVATLMDTLTWQGMAAYGAALIFAKTCHELGHAFTAKHFGCRVPTMGVAFLVMWPVAYTDTNEVWKLSRREQRLVVAGAGILTELAIAAWATLAWAWLPEGGPKQIAFLLSTTTWISTLVINGSPFMRFDGYFLLSDYLGIPNLHSRSFALARWDLRERLFHLNEPAPEHFSPRMHKGLVIFAWAVWIYRLVLFLGIAALVYHFFIKAVGIFLFAVEISWFIAMPLWRELKEWHNRWPAIRQGGRVRFSALCALSLVMLIFIPWPNRMLTSGLLQPQQRMALYAPVHAVIDALPVANGQAVAAGQPLLSLASPDLDLRAEEAGARQGALRWQSGAAAFDNTTRKNWQLLQDQLAHANAEQATVGADLQRYRPIAPYRGLLVDVDPDLRPGDWLKSQEPLGELIGEGGWQVVTYVDEDEIRRLAIGDRALFIAEGLGGPNLSAHVTSIDRNASRTLGEGALATLSGGHVLVRESNGILYPEQAIYRVVLGIDANVPATSQLLRGHVAIAGRWESPATRFLRTALAVAWREAGF